MAAMSSCQEQIAQLQYLSNSALPNNVTIQMRGVGMGIGMAHLLPVFPPHSLWYPGPEHLSSGAGDKLINNANACWPW